MEMEGPDDDLDDLVVEDQLEKEAKKLVVRCQSVSTDLHPTPVPLLTPYVYKTARLRFPGRKLSGRYQELPPPFHELRDVLAAARMYELTIVSRDAPPWGHAQHRWQSSLQGLFDGVYAGSIDSFSVVGRDVEFFVAYFYSQRKEKTTPSPPTRHSKGGAKRKKEEEALKSSKPGRGTQTPKGGAKRKKEEEDLKSSKRGSGKRRRAVNTKDEEDEDEEEEDKDEEDEKEKEEREVVCVLVGELVCMEYREGAAVRAQFSAMARNEAAEPGDTSEGGEP
eukprot:Hpha_TRINITY_DN12198_c0_g1::TRINITY_DN12198_c0_g1_i1::g.81801::m.81801